MSMADLIAAGAPELPEGFFYRVRNGRWLAVEIRASRIVGSRLVGRAWVAEPLYADLTRGVITTCRDLVAAIDRASIKAQLVGDYDPRREK